MSYHSTRAVKRHRGRDLKDSLCYFPLFVHAHTRTNTPKYTHGRVPLGQNTRLNEKKKKSSKTSFIYVPFFPQPSPFVICRIPLFISFLSICYLRWKCQKWKLHRGVWQRKHTQHSAIVIQSDKYPFVLGVSQRDKRLRASTHTHTTHTLTPTQQAAAAFPRLRWLLYRAETLFWWRCPRSWIADVAQELSRVLKHAFGFFMLRSGEQQACFSLKIALLMNCFTL